MLSKMEVQSQLFLANWVLLLHVLTCRIFCLQFTVNFIERCGMRLNKRIDWVTDTVHGLIAVAVSLSLRANDVLTFLVSEYYHEQKWENRQNANRNYNKWMFFIMSCTLCNPSIWIWQSYGVCCMWFSLTFFLEHIQNVVCTNCGTSCQTQRLSNTKKSLSIDLSYSRVRLSSAKTSENWATQRYDGIHTTIDIVVGWQQKYTEYRIFSLCVFFSLLRIIKCWKLLLSKVWKN